jgi:hypothetical protein
MPYWHAQELLADNRGKLFDFKDSEGLAHIVNELFEDPKRLKLLQRNAYDYGLHLRWPVTGKVFIKTLNAAILHSNLVKDETKPIIDPDMMPAFSMTHILRLTDDTGIVQHAKYGIPNLKEGYCLDDNARALLLTILAPTEQK